MFPLHLKKEKRTKIPDKRIHSLWVWCTHEEGGTETQYLLNEDNKDDFIQLPTSIVTNGKYLSLNMNHNGVTENVQCQRLVHGAFHPEMVKRDEVEEKNTEYTHEYFGNSTQVDHIDRNGLNNHISNLRVTLPAENKSRQKDRPHFHNMRLIQDDRSGWNPALKFRADPAWSGCQECKKWEKATRKGKQGSASRARARANAQQ